MSETAAPNFQSIPLLGTNGSAAQAASTAALTRPVNESFTHDLDGNLTEDSLWHYEYDGENRLRAMFGKVTDATGAPAALIFTYDYLGRRVTKEVRSFTGPVTAPVLGTLRSKTYFAYSGWTLVAEYDGSTTIGALRRRFTWGKPLAGSDAGGLLAIEDLSTLNSQPSTLAGTYLAVHDGNGNVTALVNATGGATAAEYEYDPFGNILRASGRYGAENPFRYAGKYLDRETGLSYYGFRYYSASLGRFINRDPISEAGGLNLYGFANNDGINGGDFLGLAWYNNWSDFKGMVSGAWKSFTGGIASIGNGFSRGWNTVTSPSRSASSANNSRAAAAAVPPGSEVVVLPVYTTTAEKYAEDTDRTPGYHFRTEPASLARVVEFLNPMTHLNAIGNTVAWLEDGVRAINHDLNSVGLAVDPVMLDGGIRVAPFAAPYLRFPRLRIVAAERTAAGAADDLFSSTMKQVEKLDFSTGRNKAVFYSGPGNRGRALSFAERTGATPIDLTPGGRALDALKLYDILPSAQADAIWARASQLYVGRAQGSINLFVKGARPDRVFNMFERPLLESNVDVYRWVFHY